MCSIRDFENIMRRIITNNGVCSVKLKKKITILMYVSVYWYITDIRIYIYIYRWSGAHSNPIQIRREAGLAKRFSN